MKKYLTTVKAILLVVISFFLLSTNTVQAKELTNVISSINLWDASEGKYVTQTGGAYQLVQGKNYRFETTFDLSAYNGNLEDGDKFTLTIPAPFTVNDGTTINLTDTETGVVVGTAVVSSNGMGQGGAVTITLQNLVDYLAAKGGTEIQGVKGTFYVGFTVSELMTNQTVTYSATETTGTISHTITVKERGTSDYSDAIGKANFSKFGGVLTKRAWISESLGTSGEYVHPWTVRVNVRQASYNTITVSDTIEQNYAPMQYIPETLKVQYGYYNSSYSFSYDGELVEGVDYTIEYNSSYTGFKLKILNTSTRLAVNGQPAAYQLSYSTTAPADGSTVANTVAVTGDDIPLTITTETTTTSTTITRTSKIAEGGTITLDTGYRIILYKVDGETGSRLSGATFTITTPSDNTSIITTDENGRAYSEVYSAEEVAKGDFTITEVTAPAGYQLLTEPITVTVGSEGVIKTISNTKERVSVPVTKTWNDSDNQDGTRPNTVVVKLYANGELVEGEALSLSEDNNWSDSFDNLDKYDSGGNEISYTVEEDVVDSYTSEITGDATNGYTITNTHIPETTEVSGTKTWDDNNNQDGIRPESIVVHLLANGVDTGQTKEVSQTDNWTYQFENLPKYQNGQEIVYTVSEDDVAGYETIISGFNITNSHTPETTEVFGTKTWNDNDDQDGKRPNSITVNLLANGTKVASQEVTADTNWTYTFSNLAKYANGSAITYTVTEDSVDNYTTTINGYDITNSYTPGKTSLTVTKVWDDSDDQDGLRPNSIDVQLYANGKKSGDVVTLTAADSWTYTWTNLAEKADKKDIVYSVKEVTEVDGYTTTEGKVESGNVTITNTYTPETIQVSGTKTWNDNKNSVGLRPDSITVNLLADGIVVNSQTVTSESDWNYTFTDLPKYANGNEITYTVTEDTVANYTPTYDGYNITNNYTPDETSLTVTKAWNDNNNQDGIRPDAIQVQLYADGEKSGDAITLTAADNWTYTWTNLDKNLTYTVKEVSDIDGYTATVGDVEDGNVTITNTHTPTTPETPSSDEPTTPSQSDKQSNKKKNIITAFLPSTGDSDGFGLSILGFILIIAVVSLVYHHTRKL